MDAPTNFVAWLTSHEHVDPTYGWVYHYHSRSDSHSVALSRLIVADLVDACPMLREQALADRIVYGINARHVFPNGKKKPSISPSAPPRPSSSRANSPTG